MSNFSDFDSSEPYVLYQCAIFLLYQLIGKDMRSSHELNPQCVTFLISQPIRNGLSTLIDSDRFPTQSYIVSQQEDNYSANRERAEIFQ